MVRFLRAAVVLLLAAVPASGQVHRYDFGPATGPVAAGFTRIAPRTPTPRGGATAS